MRYSYLYKVATKQWYISLTVTQIHKFSKISAQAMWDIVYLIS